MSFSVLNIQYPFGWITIEKKVMARHSIATDMDYISVEFVWQKGILFLLPVKNHSNRHKQQINHYINKFRNEINKSPMMRAVK